MKWGCQTIVNKELASDAAVDLDGFLWHVFLRSLRPGMEISGDIEWERIDADESPTNFGFTLDDGTEVPPLENAWVYRGTAEVSGGDS